MKPVIADASAAATYLRALFSAPEHALAAVERMDALPEHDRTLAVLYLAERCPAAFADALASLPCMAGCGHRRHEGENCVAAFMHPWGEGLCPCGPERAEPVVLSLTRAQVDNAARLAARAGETADDEARWAAREAAL